MHNNQKPEAPDAPDSGLVLPKSASRRQLLRAGIGAAPVVLTVVSSPVRAGNCYSASAFASTNAVMTAGTSANAHQIVQSCAGQSPSWWANDATNNSWKSWPANCKSGGTYWSIPGCLGANSPSYKQPDGVSTANLLSALQDTRTDSTSQMAKYMAAVLLNVKSGKVPSILLSDTQMSAIWQLAPSGNYNPVGSVKWGLQDVYNWMIANGIVLA